MNAAGPQFSVADRLLAWYARHGRHDLPWKTGRDPYRIWLSEVMLQQTQVKTVLPYFARFIERFPDVASLAAAGVDEVLALWTGLGYYSRARNLHAAAQRLVVEHNGALPADPEALAGLPGIGPSTANAIAAMAYDVRAPILDGNVKRVLTRLHGIEGWPGQRAIEKALWAHAAAHTPQDGVADYTQAIMDLGATLCTRRKPACSLCPLSEGCAAFASGDPARLPTPRPKRVVPERDTRMLVLTDAAGAVLVQRRDGAGVWRGLWCFPELGENRAAASAAALLALPEARFEGPRPLPELTHTFTHYRLTVRPEWVRLRGIAPGIADGGKALHWFTSGDGDALGLAAPVGRLLPLLETPDPIHEEEIA